MIDQNLQDLLIENTVTLKQDILINFLRVNEK